MLNRAQSLNGIRHDHTPKHGLKLFLCLDRFKHGSDWFCKVLWAKLYFYLFLFSNEERTKTTISYRYKTFRPYALCLSVRILTSPWVLPRLTIQVLFNRHSDWVKGACCLAARRLNCVAATYLTGYWAARSRMRSVSAEEQHMVLLNETVAWFLSLCKDAWRGLR